MKIEILDNCPACNSVAIEKYTDIPDFYFSKKVFPVFQCCNCGLKFTQNRPAEEEIGRYYDSANYASHDSEKKQNLFSIVYKSARDYMLGQKFQLIRQFIPEWQKVLDYGTGEGTFTEYLLKKGLDAEGIEPSELARDNFKSRTGKTLYPNLISLPAGKEYDAISMWHVLEHIHQLRDTMEKLVSVLRKKGVMAIAVPNQNSIDSREFGVHWAAWDVPRHLYHWNLESLSTFMENLGMKQVYCGQLPLDPFYIGMISARYENKNPVGGILKGLRSYLHGKKHPSEGSTLLTIWMKP
jgi:SAM-dependent methyltransferase